MAFCSTALDPLQERQQHEDELEYNQGVWWQRKLSAGLIQTESAAAKGIKRLDDKVVGISEHSEGVVFHFLLVSWE